MPARLPDTTPDTASHTTAHPPGRARQAARQGWVFLPASTPAGAQGGQPRVRVTSGLSGFPCWLWGPSEGSGGMHPHPPRKYAERSAGAAGGDPQGAGGDP